MFKFVCLVAVVFVLTISAAVRTKAREEPPNLRLTLSIENTTWPNYEPVPVKITIENLSGRKLALPSSISFRLDNRRLGNTSETMSEGVFWSPVSLTKAYDADVTGCQSDLVGDRVEVLKGTNTVSISPPKDNLTMTKGEKREFSFDLTKTCWNHAISSTYPDSHLFSLIRSTPSAKLMRSNTYKVYFEMEFKAGTVGGIPQTKHLKSNEIEISVG